MRSEIFVFPVPCAHGIEFQSSFYEDALWNHTAWFSDRAFTHSFQSSFYEDALWNLRSQEPLIHGASFQSSFYEDALWNWLPIQWSVAACLRFNPHFTRMRSEIYYLCLSKRVPACFNPHFTRMRSEMLIIVCTVLAEIFVSILILRGCALKSCSHRYDWTSKPGFNPHFTRMRSEIIQRADMYVQVNCFNPHFTRMRSEIRLLDDQLKERKCFNPHFTRMRSEINRLRLIKAPDECFNPHFTRMRSEIDEPHRGEEWWNIVSILILRGCALKCAKAKASIIYMG